MIKFIKNFLAKQIQINITIIEYADPNINSTTESKGTFEILHCSKVKKSNLRFTKEIRTDHDSERTEYFTEVYKDGKWSKDYYSASHNKDEAMRLHMILLAGDKLSPTRHTTVLWEGLSEEETQMWVTLQSKGESK